MSSDRDLCIVSHPLGNGGGTALKSLLQVIEPHTDVSLVLLGEGAEFDVTNQTVIGTGYNAENPLTMAFVFLLNQLILANHLRNRAEETVLFFGATTYLIPIIVAQLVGKTVAVEPRGNLAKSFYFTFREDFPNAIAQPLSGAIGKLDRIGMWCADYVITLSPTMAVDLGLDPSSPSVLPNGAWSVDTDEFSIQILPVDRDREIAFVGRLEPEKGVDRMVEITEAISSRTRIRFVGDGSYYELIERRLKPAIDEGQVVLDGWVSHEQLPNLLNNCRMIVVPSRTEGLPTTVLEAFACGVPAAATPVAGVPDIVEDGTTGILIDPEAPEVTAKRIEDALDQEYIGMAEAARDLIEAEYTTESAVARYREIIETICTVEPDS
jgi:hypothetical protein